MKSFLDKREDWLLVLTAFALAGLLLGGVAFTHPLTRPVLKDIQYEQKGAFTYSAPVADTTHIYDFPSVQTGEPVYTRLSNRVNIRFDYQIVSDSPIQATGSVRLVTRLSAPDGWQQTLESQPAVPFIGPSAGVSGTVDLFQILTVLNNLQNRTGVQRQVYDVLIKPQVLLEGTIGGQAVSESFAPILVFQIDPYELQLNRFDAAGNDTLNPSISGSIKMPAGVPNTLPILGLQLRVLAARWLSVVVLVLSLGGLAFLIAFAYRNAKTEGEVARIQRKYGSLLVSSPGYQAKRAERVIEVESIDDLARLADKDGRLILHTEQTGQHVYLVQDTGLVYRYKTTEGEDKRYKTKVRK